MRRIIAIFIICASTVNGLTLIPTFNSISVESDVQSGTPVMEYKQAGINSWLPGMEMYVDLNQVMQSIRLWKNGR